MEKRDSNSKQIETKMKETETQTNKERDVGSISVADQRHELTKRKRDRGSSISREITRREQNSKQQEKRDREKERETKRD